MIPSVTTGRLFAICCVCCSCAAILRGLCWNSDGPAAFEMTSGPSGVGVGISVVSERERHPPFCPEDSKPSVAVARMTVILSGLTSGEGVPSPEFIGCV